MSFYFLVIMIYSNRVNFLGIMWRYSHDNMRVNKEKRWIKYPPFFDLCLNLTYNRTGWVNVRELELTL